VGYFLLDKGRREWERAANIQMRVLPRLFRFARRHPLYFYLGGNVGLSTLMLVAFIIWVRNGNVPNAVLALLSLPVLMGVSHLAIGVMNWLTTMTIKPKVLPRMDFRAGIPAEHRTMVVIPTMLGEARVIHELLDRIEIHYAANPDPRLHFALLTDFKDAPRETMPEDEEQIRLIREGIESLNEKYAANRSDAFFLFHRPRRWNPGEGVWMGHERKRGKLEEFNDWLRGGGEGCFSEIVGDGNALEQIRYVITLDTDTLLPRDAAQELVGAMAHPLNRAVLDAEGMRVVQGYGIMQPRVATNLPTASRSWFVRLFAPDSGLDPYTRVVSDVYQDLFGEGSFVGKGIYDVDAFRATCGHFPNDTVLSHDLLEGAHARSALLTEVELYEDFPARFSVDASRRHRWIRGDWQIAPWLFRRVSRRDGSRVRNPISVLSRWKIFDNLRRSLVPPAMALLFLLAWLLPWPPLAGMVTLFVVSVVATIPLFSAAAEVGRKPPDLPWGMHLRVFGPATRERLIQLIASLMFLPYEAWLSLDAIGRTLVRMGWTRRNLLEWTTSSDAARSSREDLAGYFRRMWIAPASAVVTLGLVALLHPENLPISTPLLCLWFASPYAAWFASQPIPPDTPQLTALQEMFLRKLSRKTWRYFETFVTEEENWLPPDNFQVRPAPVIASRTSPTNIGMALLANLCAYDFGYEPLSELLRRTQNTLTTLAGMERYRGHFYNWYDTRTLEPLPPHYISTVDSGNLAMNLVVLQRGLLALIDAPIVPSRMLQGIEDTLCVYIDNAQPADSSHGGDEMDKPQALLARFEHLPGTLRGIAEFLDSIVAFVEETQRDGNVEARWWAKATHDIIANHRRELAQLSPWAFTPRITYDAAGEQAPVADEIRALMFRLEAIPTLRDVANLEAALLPILDALTDKYPGGDSGSAPVWLAELRMAIAEAVQHAANRILALEDAAAYCGELASMDFAFLYDKTRELFSIGYNVSDNRMDSGYYDLLASEARVASYLAIAQGQVGQEHWFALRRTLTASTGLPALLSWNGSMFEYLMPLVVMPTYEQTLLDETYKAVVQRQIKYGKQLGLPWGISESGYNLRDLHHNYQYRGFGVPGLGLKRGLAEDRVVAPYATMLALMIAPEAACRNLERLAAEGREGPYGFFEAIDYTPARLARGRDSALIWSFMVHHQGMSLLSMAYLLLDRPMQQRFYADPALRATELLLQERVPRLTAPIFPHALEVVAPRAAQADSEETMRIFNNPAVGTPEIHLLSNQRYHVMLSSAGSGYSRWHDYAITRWREDPTRDCWGSFCYLRDTETGKFWSIAHQPVIEAPSATRYEAVFGQGKAEFRRQDEQIELHTEICVSPEDDIELRRTTVTNRSDRTRTIEVTSYAEVVLAPAGQDLAHPAFSNLFVQTELLRAREAILCTRRPRSADEQPPWMMHLMTVQGEVAGEISFETNRLNFIGRGRTPANPAAMDHGGPLSDTEGSVLDPIVSIRRAIVLPPGETVRIDLVTGAAESREAIMAITEKYHDRRLCDRVPELAWTHSQVELRQINATEGDAQRFLRLAGTVVYTTPAHRANREILARNRRAQSGLWGHGISGDLPIVLVRIADHANIDLVRQALQAHAYWRLKGLVCDLVIWNEDESVYRQDLFDTIVNLIAASPEAGLIDRPGGVFLRRGEQIPEEDRTLLLAVARVVLIDDAGTLREQTETRARRDLAIPDFKPVRRRVSFPTRSAAPRNDLAYFNGLGGFTHDGREYITTLRAGENTPAPWVNVIANPHFGTVVSESGSVYTWSENCHEYRITPWSNDPVSDESGEAVYLRDDESGYVWSPSPYPARAANPYSTRHGFGYTVFEVEEEGIASAMTLYVALDAPVKFVRLKISNRSGQPRRLSATAYWELLLGETRGKTLMHVSTEIDGPTGAIFARNAYSTEFGSRIAFFGTSESTHFVTADRCEFLGRNGSTADPAALRRARLSGRTGAGFDPCAVIQTPLQIEDGGERELVFFVGAASSEAEARTIIHGHRGLGHAQRCLEAVWNYWARTLGAVHVETPDAALNFLVNGWLPYQTLACRVWARTGFYQSGGAYGFRDQLQDTMALIHAEPRLLREHLLRAAARQFAEGDVQHWWHPHSGRGVRTHFSDDYLWLPCAVCRYVHATGDTGVLEESIPFLEGRAVRPEEEGYYDLPQISPEQGTLYEHCVRAVKNGLRFGAHGLPLMGCGDWNDGMNLVGEHGKGESVWLAFFLYDVLKQFGALARRHSDGAFADACEAEANALARRIEESAWDGAWYRRAYFDDGQPLGSAQNEECQIDAIAQSWSVLSGAGSPERARQAMESVDQRLVRRDARLIQLFEPPFDKSDLNPGYIKGYIPGVRENGGQYTHAAIWTAMAFAALDDPKRAWEMLSLLNPISHSDSADDAQLYRAEPYVIAADVYGAEPHTGRGGWTWYTGSASWMYRFITESLLGLRLETDILRFTPCPHPEWSAYKVHYRYRETFYHITIHCGEGGKQVIYLALDGARQTENFLRLIDDRMPHDVDIRLD
jgi:cellobiose phosphorylase